MALAPACDPQPQGRGLPHFPMSRLAELHTLAAAIITRKLRIANLWMPRLPRAKGLHQTNYLGCKREA